MTNKCEAKFPQFPHWEKFTLTYYWQKFRDSNFSIEKVKSQNTCFHELFFQWEWISRFSTLFYSISFFSGIHSCDNNQIYAKCHQHFHCQPGNGRHVGNVILCPSFSHLGCDKYMDFWISYVSNCHLHSSKSILMGKKV